jgi:signal recognition particle subunit SRP54
MFVGLQGAGKTTTVTKLAYHYKRKGWKACLVCADTFRAGAYDQLRQNATKAKLPFYGSYTETDPVVVAAEGVEKFKEAGYEIIIVDTSGRHKQEEALFEEMQEVAAATKPDSIVFVMDGSIGQAAQAQAAAFKSTVDVGAVIITKMDSKNRRGGGALSAVAATQSPILFLGTGEHMDDLEPFVVRAFVSKLLGMGDMPELVKKIQSVVPADKQPEMAARLAQGIFTLRDMHDQFESILKMGPIGKMMEMMPGMSNLAQQAQQSGVDSSQKVRNYMVIMDSMTDQELDDSDVLFRRDERDSRIRRISRGSGRQVAEVHELLDQYQHFAKMMKKMKGVNLGTGKGGPGALNQRSLQQMQNMLPPGALAQMGGMGGLQKLMKSMGQ